MAFGARKDDLDIGGRDPEYTISLAELMLGVWFIRNTGFQCIKATMENKNNYIKFCFYNLGAIYYTNSNFILKQQMTNKKGL